MQLALYEVESLFDPSEAELRSPQQELSVPFKVDISVRRRSLAQPSRQNDLGCLSTVYARAGKHPQIIGVAVGAIADPSFQPPVRSVWEESMHDWVTIAAALQHFPRRRG
jgi:hypothetical protein